MTLYQVCYAIAGLLALLSLFLTQMPYALVAAVILLAVGGLIAPR
jgi:hypothetical protein